MKWRNKFLYFSLFFLLFGVIFFYLYRLRPITDDELYNYGYVHNIMSGLVPYRDFNMIVCPLFFYLMVPFFYVLGDKLIVYHFILSFLITFIFFEGFKRINYQMIAVLAFLLFYPYAGYNLFCLFLLFLMMFYQDGEGTMRFRPLFIVMMFLTKQTLGLMMIPSFIETKNRKKLAFIYLVFLLIFILYLVSFDNFFSFVNYCFLGMFDFTSKNGTSISLLMIVEFIIMAILFIYYLKSQDISFLYLFFFQIIVFPIVDYFHFCIGFAPVVYYFFVKLKKWKFFSILTFIFSFSMVISLHFLVIYSMDYSFYSKYSDNNFMKGRLVGGNILNMIDTVSLEINTNKYQEVFILGGYSYLLKLNLNLPINSFDNINQGNMGYHGEEKYIQKISNICKNKKCIFIFDDDEASGKIKSQASKKVLNYIKNWFYQFYSSSTIDMYKNS